MRRARHGRLPLPSPDPNDHNEEVEVLEGGLLALGPWIEEQIVHSRTHQVPFADGPNADPKDDNEVLRRIIRCVELEPTARVCYLAPDKLIGGRVEQKGRSS